MTKHGINTWDQHLGCLAAYRSSQHDSTRAPPNLPMLGRDVRMPAEVMLLEPNDSVSSYSQYILELKENFRRSHESARQHLKQTSQI